jgi:uncharacterized protein with GYD domain
MATFIAQARFTKDGLNGMIAAPDDRAEAVGWLIAQVGGRLMAYYLTSGEYDVLFIFEAPSYEDTVPALIVAAVDNGLGDLKTVTALTTSEMKSAFGKARSIEASYRSRTASPEGASAAEPHTDLSSSNSRRGETFGDAQGDTKAAIDILDAEKKAVDDLRATPGPLFLGFARFRGAIAAAVLDQRRSKKVKRVMNLAAVRLNLSHDPRR